MKNAILALVVAGLVVGWTRDAPTGLEQALAPLPSNAQLARADAPATLQIAIPVNVQVVVGQSEVNFIGRPTSISPVACAPGTPHPQSVVVVDPGGGHASQVTGVLAYHDHEIPNGSRYQITAGPDPCNTDFRLYTGTLK